MILRNGIKIPWHAFTHFKATDVYVKRVYMNTLYEFWHTGGRVHFSSHQVQDADAVVKFILSHLPSQAVTLTRGDDVYPSCRERKGARLRAASLEAARRYQRTRRFDPLSVVENSGF